MNGMQPVASKRAVVGNPNCGYPIIGVTGQGCPYNFSLYVRQPFGSTRIGLETWPFIVTCRAFRSRERVSPTLIFALLPRLIYD